MTTIQKIQSLVLAGGIMLLGLTLFKWIPMYVWGTDVRFDASMHITTAIFALYVLWYFIDQNKRWRMPFFIFSIAVVCIISIQRILVDAHNDIGLLLGLSIAGIAIIVSRRAYFKGKIDF